MDNLLSFLGLMRQAGAISPGAERALASCREGKAHLVLLASDTADNTLKAALRTCEAEGIDVVYLPWDKQTVGASLGMNDCAVFSINNKGFALSIKEKLARAYPPDSTVKKTGGQSMEGRKDTTAKRGNVR